MIGAVLSLLVAAAAVIAAIVAWPQLQSLTSRPQGRRPVSSAPREVAVATQPTVVVTSTSEPPPRAEPHVREARVRRDRDERPRAADTPAAAPAPAIEPSVVDAEAAAPRSEASPEAARAAEDEVTRQLRSAAAMLRRHDDQAAAASLDAAAHAADGHAELASRVDRWRLLLDYARQLDGHVAEAIASANEGREYEIGGRTISIVEIGPGTFVYKESGQMRRGKQLPRVVERAILSAWFDGAPRPANHILLGIHRLLDDDFDLTKVRKEWQTAALGEPATQSIMPLLEDPALAPATDR